MRKDEYAWLYFLLLGGAMSNKGKWEDPARMKRRNSSLFALVLLLIFIVSIVIYKTVEGVKERGRVETAQAAAAELAQGFANSNDDIINNWVAGGFIDPWGNQFAVLLNSADKGVIVRSRGPDKAQDTEDDILGKADYPKVVENNPLKVEEIKEGIFDKVKGFFRRGKDEPDICDDQT